MPKSKLCLIQQSMELGLGNVNENELYDAMDWLNDEQQSVENRLAHGHLEEGVKCPLPKRSYSKDGKKDSHSSTFLVPSRNEWVHQDPQRMENLACLLGERIAHPSDFQSHHLTKWLLDSPLHPTSFPIPICAFSFPEGTRSA